MIYLAYFILGSPILAMIFFIFYKLILLIQEKRQNKHHYQYSRSPQIYAKPDVKSTSPVIIRDAGDSSEEIQAVISAAVAVYLKKV
jgi:hypothetical protein